MIRWYDVLEDILALAAILVIVIVASLWLACSGCSSQLSSPTVSRIATSQPVEVNTGLKALIDPIIRLFTRDRNVSISNNSGRVSVEQGSGWYKYAVGGGAAGMGLWLMPSGWPFRRRQQKHMVLELRFPPSK